MGPGTFKSQDPARMAQAIVKAVTPYNDAAIIAELKKQGADDIVVFVGGVVPQQDYDFLYAAGVKGIYGPGTPIPASAKDVLEQIRAALKK